ncbi:hypothetical protein BSL78_19078 [Apostichopus japonicus]|uniref:Trafficking protein particle complex subunit 13 n=1 Tax=Stichopus japonicus TaxID=307972 RepID=A0A2G8K7T4_STIJA|nr:hypothetical protein BSL78_19078 [Apostichopus japonicus]
MGQKKFFVTSCRTIENNSHRSSGQRVRIKGTVISSSKYERNKHKSAMLTSLPNSIFGAITYVNPMDTRQYLYRLQAKPQQGSERGTFTKGVSSIGKLDIVWKTNLGERGRLQTSPLQRVSPGCGDIKLVVLQIPDSITLQSSFKFLCKLTSCCERTMDLKLNLQNAGTGLSWMGISGKQLGKLGPGDSLQIELSMLSTIPGLQSISGLRIIDQNLKRTYEHDDIAQIFVHHAQMAA